MRNFKMILCLLMLMTSSMVVNAQTEITNEVILEWEADGNPEQDIISELKNPINKFNIKGGMDFWKKLNNFNPSDELKNAIRSVIENSSTNNANNATENTTASKLGVFLITAKGEEALDCSLFSVKENKWSAGNILRKAGDAMSSIGILKGGIGGITTMIKGIQIANMASVLGETGFHTEKLFLKDSQSKTRVQGEQASNPTFRFYLPNITSQDPKNTWYYKVMGSSTPQDFLCVKLKSNKKDRTFPAGKELSVLSSSFNLNKGSDFVEFTVNEISQNVYEVTFPNGIEPGEYCFYYKNYKNPELNNNFPSFDFAVE